MLRTRVKGILAGFVLIAAGSVSGPALSSALIEINYTLNGVLVPYANFNATDTTAVGLTSSQAGTVYWAFFDANGNRRTQGSFVTNAYQLYSFVWSSQAATAPGGAALANTEGYLLFALDSDGSGTITGADSPALGGNAFHVSLGDVAFQPVLPVDAGMLVDPNPANWTVAGVNPGSYLGLGFFEGAPLYVQYVIDTTPGGDRTRMHVWCDTNFTLVQSMTLDNGAGVTQAVNVQMLNSRLNVIDIEQIPGINPAFNGGGFIRWTMAGQAGGCSIFSVAYSPVFAATQTLDARLLIDP